MDRRAVMQTEYSAFFAGEERAFALSMERLGILQREREAGASIFELFDWLGKILGEVNGQTVLIGGSEIDPKRCQSIIRNALIGGGLPDTKETWDLVGDYTWPARPAIQDAELAFRILEASIYGVKLKKKDSGAVAESQEVSTEAQSSSTARHSASTTKRRRSANT